VLTRFIHHISSYFFINWGEQISNAFNFVKFPLWQRQNKEPYECVSGEDSPVVFAINLHFILLHYALINNKKFPWAEHVMKHHQWWRAAALKAHPWPTVSTHTLTLTHTHVNSCLSQVRGQQRSRCWCFHSHVVTHTTSFHTIPVIWFSSNLYPALFSSIQVYSTLFSSNHLYAALFSSIQLYSALIISIQL